jgi:putative ATP-dependent endonuclease of OLD family
LYISRVIINNYRCLGAADVTLNPNLNIIVGDNESGKSTLLEAIYLALTGQLNGRPIQTELHPHLFNAETVANYIADLIKKTSAAPPAILIELYFHDDAALSKLKGTNNTLGTDLPGVALSIDMRRNSKPTSRTRASSGRCLSNITL